MATSSPTSIAQIAFRLRSTREALELTPTELCKQVGIRTNTWSQWENGKGRPELDKGLLLCDKLGVTLDWIYRGDPGGLPVRIASKLRILTDRAKAS